VPALTVPALTVPALAAPALTAPALTMPALAMPSTRPEAAIAARTKPPRKLAALGCAVALVALCGLSLALLTAASGAQPPLYVPVSIAGSTYSLEVDRSPGCPNGVLGLCDRGGRGMLYATVWRTWWSSPDQQHAQRLLAVPVAP
jgi:hypothetical protein